MLGVGATSAGEVEQPMAVINKAVPTASRQTLGSFILNAPGCAILKLVMGLLPRS